MEQNLKHNPLRHEQSSPPLGAVYESPPDLLQQMRYLNTQNPAFASWVLVCAQQIVSLAELATQTDKTVDLKSFVSQKLIEAYDMHGAHIDCERILKLLKT